MKTFKFPIAPLALILAFLFALSTSQAAVKPAECPERCVSDEILCCKTPGGSLYFGHIE
jgi:hypothetical protein